MTLYTDELQKAYQAGVNSVLISQTNLNQPGESGPYQDKTTYPKETEGQKLDKKNPTYTEDGIIDTGELDQSGQPLMIKGNPLDDATLNQGKFRNDARQRKIRNLVDQGATEGEKKAAKGKLKDQTDLPNFLQNININPADALKIIGPLLWQLAPKPRFGGAMADQGSPRDQLMAMAPGALDALRKGTQPGLSSQEIRKLIEPFTIKDQFGNPSGSLRI